MKISIKAKSVIFLAVVILAAMSILSILVLHGIQSNQKKQYEDYLVQQGEIASNYVKQTYLMESIKDSRKFLMERSLELAKRFDTMTGMQIVIYDMSGREAADSRPASGGFDVSSLIPYALQDKNTYSESGSNIVFLSPLHNSQTQIGVIGFCYSIEEGRTFYNNIKNLFLFGGISVFVICFICAYLFINPMSKGIMRLKDIALGIEEGKYPCDVPMKRNDELGELSRSIYSMGTKIKNNIEDMQKEQNKLKLAVEKLEVLGEQQKVFIGNVTHEFKTPLTVIKAYADLMEMYQGDGDLMREANEKINNEVRHLTGMVEKVLELSALGKYDFELHKERVDVCDLLESICLRMNGKIQKYGLKLNTRLEHQMLTADSESLKQIFINLIDNAVKYNLPDGEIWLECGRVENEIRITIRNTGVGIPAEARDRIFEPFYTVNKDRSRLSGGTGLGLSLVKQLVEKQGGSIVLLDTVDGETEFEILFSVQ